MEHLDMQTPDGNKLNLDSLYKICPSCFTETKDDDGSFRRVIDWNKLRTLLGNDAVEDAPEEKKQQDGFILYSQKDGWWTDKRYSSSNRSSVYKYF